MNIKTLVSAILIVTGVTWVASAAEAAGKPNGGGQILPISLGGSANCSSSWGSALNDGTSFGLYVVGQGGGCPGSIPQAIRWSSGTGMIELGTLPGSTGSSAEGVSEDGTVVGWTAGGAGLAFVLPPGGVTLLALPLLSGMVYGQANDISSNGSYIVGINSTETDLRAVRWERSGASWSARDLDPGMLGWGTVSAVSDDGKVVMTKYVVDAITGAEIRYARIWTETQNAWVDLPGADTQAHDINRLGTLVVGIRWEACAAPNCEYEVPVFWSLNGDNWTGPYDLPALDGVDSEALGVGEKNGLTVIVGYGYTKKDAIMRAVAWMPRTDGTYGLVRLAGINGRSRAWAKASDVNHIGQVVGTSAGRGLDIFAVLWTLP